MTLSTLAGLANVKKANPRERPDGSRIIVLEAISPNVPMYALSPSAWYQQIPRDLYLALLRTYHRSSPSLNLQ